MTDATTEHFDQIEMPLWDFAGLKLPTSGKWQDDSTNCLDLTVSDTKQFV